MAYPLLDLGGAVKAGISQGSRESHKPRVRKAQFGNGYGQASGDGRNADPITYAVKLTNLTKAEANTFMAFMASRKGYLPFKWVMPGDSQPRQWVCPEWDREPTEKALISGINATFVEDFSA